MIVAKKRFGQNFLKDDMALNKIIQSMPRNENIIVEIGPGLGDLTKKLITEKKTVAFEVDEGLCRYLKVELSEKIKNGSLILFCKDVLKAWKKGSLVDQKYDLIANLPYYIATTIILKALKDKNCRNIIAMTQKEVAIKFAAKPAQKEFGSLSVLSQSIGEAKILFDVDAKSFDPPPKVTSSVLQICKKDDFFVESGNGVFQDEKEYISFENFLKTAFKAPRKTLKKNLSSSYDKEKLDLIFEELDIKQNFRPHQLTVSKFHLLFFKLNK